MLHSSLHGTLNFVTWICLGLNPLHSSLHGTGPSRLLPDGVGQPVTLFSSWNSLWRKRMPTHFRRYTLLFMEPKGGGPGHGGVVMSYTLLFMEPLNETTKHTIIIKLHSSLHGTLRMICGAASSSSVTLFSSWNEIDLRSASPQTAYLLHSSLHGTESFLNTHHERCGAGYTLLFMELKWAFRDLQARIRQRYTLLFMEHRGGGEEMTRFIVVTLFSSWNRTSIRSIFNPVSKLHSSLHGTEFLGILDRLGIIQVTLFSSWNRCRQ